MSQTYFAGRPLVNETMPDEAQHRRELARAVNNNTNGLTNESMSLTLDGATWNTGALTIGLTGTGHATAGDGEVITVNDAMLGFWRGRERRSDPRQCDPEWRHCGHRRGGHRRSLDRIGFERKRHRCRCGRVCGVQRNTDD